MKRLWIGVVMLCVVSGCATSGTQGVLQTDESAVQLRSMQTRAFDTNDKAKMMRSVISTMQDLDFLIDKADLELGTATGTKFYELNTVRMTVTVRPQGEKQMLVRVNAQYGIKAIDQPQQYQDFFDALSKAVFLTAQQVD